MPHHDRPSSPSVTYDTSGHCPVAMSSREASVSAAADTRAVELSASSAGGSIASTSRDSKIESSGSAHGLPTAHGTSNNGSSSVGTAGPRIEMGPNDGSR